MIPVSIFDKRGFPRTVWTYQADEFSSAYGKIHLADRLFFFIIPMETAP